MFSVDDGVLFFLQRNMRTTSKKNNPRRPTATMSPVSVDVRLESLLLLLPLPSEANEVGEAVGAVGGGVGVNVVGVLDGANVGGSVGLLVGRLVGVAVGTRVGNVVGTAVGMRVGDAVGDAVVGTSVGAPVGTCVGAFVGLNVGTDVGTAVVGALVGALVGDCVGLNVGAFVGAFVGACVGAVVGTLDGAAVGENVGACVGQLLHMTKQIAATAASLQSVTPAVPHTEMSGAANPGQRGVAVGESVGHASHVTGHAEDTLTSAQLPISALHPGASGLPIKKQDITKGKKYVAISLDSTEEKR